MEIVIKKDMQNIVHIMNENQTLVLEKLKFQGLNVYRSTDLKDQLSHALKGPLGRISTLFSFYKTESNRTYLELMQKEIKTVLNILDIDIKPQRQNLKAKTQEIWQQLIGENEKDLKFNNLIPQDLQITIGKSVLQ